LDNAAEKFLTNKNDVIDGTVFEAIRSLIQDGDNVEWNMQIIGEVTDTIESMLIERGFETCHPWYDEDENICYKVDRCVYCKVVNCDV